MDLTSLSHDDTDDDIIALAGKANSPKGMTAAVCVYPRFVPIAKKTLRELGADAVRVATVCVFPHGRADIELAVAETKACVAYGADEVVTVIPYRALMAGDEAICREQLAAVKEACGDAALKVILETGELKSPELIRKASEIAVEAGAHFIKTSTGKVSVNATLEATAIMLDAIYLSGTECGLKVAGGVRTAEDARNYLEQAHNIFGESFLIAKRFRFGASGLLGALLETLGATDGAESPSSESY